MEDDKKTTEELLNKLSEMYQRIAELEDLEEKIISTDKDLEEDNLVLHGIFDFSPDAIIVVDYGGRITLINRHAELMFGYKQEELLYKHIEVLIADQFREKHKEYCKSYIDEPHSGHMGENLEIYAKHKNGNEFPVDVMLSNLEISDKPLIITVVRDITNRKNIEKERNQLASFPELNVNPVIETDLECKITYLNSVAQKHFPNLTNACNEHPILKNLDSIITSLREENSKDRVIHEVEFNNRFYEQQISYVPEFERIRLYISDITERKKAQEEMRKLSMAVEKSTDWVYITDKNGNIEYVNEAVVKTSGYEKEELLGQNPRIWQSGKHNNDFYKKLWDTILSGQTFFSVIVNRGKDGELFYVDHTITPLKDDNGDITHFVSTAKDITQQKRMEEKVNYLAYYDILTGLPNRSLFLDRLKQSILEARHNESKIAVLNTDLDRFKFVNDTLGPDVGDEVLTKIGQRLLNSVGEENTVARLGSDEFGIILADIEKVEDITSFIRNIIKDVSKNIDIDGEKVKITLSIGVSVYPQDGKTANELVKNADTSLAQVKSEGGNDYQFFTPEMNEKVLEFVLMERHLQNALNNEEYLLHYQPYFDLDTGEMVGMESLIRWKSDDLGLISPGKFIPVLEETKLIIPVGEWIIKEVCRQMKEWQEKGYSVVPISVNISPVQFMQKNLPQMVDEIIQEFELDPKYFIIEITESTFKQSLEHTNLLLKEFKDMGVSISIDDFGTGYSSLSYLKRFPLDNLKIDMSFIREITTNPDDASIVTAIISMAHNLGLKTIAEGVETEEHWKILRILKCDIAQGYYSSKPLPAEDVEKMFVE